LEAIVARPDADGNIKQIAKQFNDTSIGTVADQQARMSWNSQVFVIGK
jgi:hypothetical protein